MESAAILQFQKKQEAPFLCAACGAERGCKCNAPAVERVAELRERERQKKQRQRQKAKENKDHVPGTADPIEEECTDCDTPQEFWERSLSNMAGDAISMRAYWTRQFGNWQSFEIPTSLITLAEQASEEWSTLANLLRTRTK